jgi:tetrapyrrole methylase family protein / MazG family protein
MPDNEHKFNDLLRIVARLREPGGCPWDRKQTAGSFKSYVIEEAHELLEAIDAGEPEHIREELGDLLFQLIFLARLYEEKGFFGMAGVIETISAKMVRRHPHVFGDIQAGTEEELRRRWNDIKKGEKKDGSRHNALASVPKSLPALRRAQRVSERGAEGEPGRQTLAGALDQLAKKSAGMAEALRLDTGAQAVGDLLLVAVEICRLAEINAEEALHKAIDRRLTTAECRAQDCPETKNTNGTS